MGIIGQNAPLAMSGQGRGMAELGALNWVIVVIYLLATNAIGSLASRGVDSAPEFQFGARNLARWMHEGLRDLKG